MTQSAYDKAYTAGRRVFYEAATETLRQSPQNYLLAVKRNGRWTPDMDKACTINNHSLSIVLDEAREQTPGGDEQIADYVEEAFWGELSTGKVGR